MCIALCPCTSSSTSNTSSATFVDIFLSGRSSWCNVIFILFCAISIVDSFQFLNKCFRTYCDLQLLPRYGRCKKEQRSTQVRKASGIRPDLGGPNVDFRSVECPSPDKTRCKLREATFVSLHLNSRELDPNPEKTFRLVFILFLQSQIVVRL